MIEKLLTLLSNNNSTYLALNLLINTVEDGELTIAEVIRYINQNNIKIRTTNNSIGDLRLSYYGDYDHIISCSKGIELYIEYIHRNTDNENWIHLLSLYIDKYDKIMYSIVIKKSNNSKRTHNKYYLAENTTAVLDFIKQFKDILEKK